MLSHATARDWLIPYADGMLAADERRRIDGHIAGCVACAAELREVRELNLLLVTLPPAPPVAVAPFWLKLQAVLPQRR
ncbi:MAG TPA: zf-HC2 domain-containing protein, partial [Candidatus Binatus sp.]|nr:zf-HC2 domain-containing protein [Candidatus Binatus sp.]